MYPPKGLAKEEDLQIQLFKPPMVFEIFLIEVLEM